jgi:hypothetical protein
MTQPETTNISFILNNFVQKWYHSTDLAELMIQPQYLRFGYQGFKLCSRVFCIRLNSNWSKIWLITIIVTSFPFTPDFKHTIHGVLEEEILLLWEIELKNKWIIK